MQDVERLLAEVPHWCPVEKAKWIYDTVRQCTPELCVEIGVFGGASLFAFAFALKQNGRGTIIGIDPWCIDSAMQGIGDDEAKKIDFEGLYNRFKDIVVREKLDGITHIIREKSEDVKWDYKKINILHIDGNHSEESVTKDLTKYLPYISEDGIIILDDINWPTVASAIEKFPQLKQIENFKTWGVYKIENRTYNA